MRLVSGIRDFTDVIRVLQDGGHGIFLEGAAVRLTLAHHAVSRPVQGRGDLGVGVLPCGVPLESQGDRLRAFGHDDVGVQAQRRLERVGVTDDGG